MNDEFRSRSLMGVGLAAALLLVPFTINHLRQGRFVLGFGTGLVVLILGVLAWMASRDRLHPWLGFAGLVPTTLVLIHLSFQQQGVIAALWAYPASLMFYFTLAERQAWVSNAGLLVIVGVASSSLLAPDLAVRVVATLVGVAIFPAIFVRVIERQRIALEARAVTDPLTGLNNRALLASTLEQAGEQTRRTGMPMSLLALDLDDFKGINDSYGHDAGDRVLVTMAEVLRDRLRRSDRAFRIGGEEFLAFLFNTSAEDGCRVAEDVRGALESQHPLNGTPVTVSIGVAGIDPQEDWEDWLRRADRKLYEAKESGRNQVAG